jgi:hypothetical protein
MYKNLIIVALLVIILMISKGLYIPNMKPVEIVRIDTFESVHDTTIYKPGKKILKDTTIYDTTYLLAKIDTGEILKDYFAKNVFKDTISFAEGSVSLVDTISQNKILGRILKASVTQKIIKEVRELRTPPPPPKAALYWGIMATKQDEKFGYGGGLMYKTANKGIFQLNYTNGKQIQLGYYSKIF